MDREKHNGGKIKESQLPVLSMDLFHLQKRSKDTYYEQIRAQLILHLLCSNIKEGDKFPTIRETARTLAINPNTVFKIYRKLEADHFLDVRQGSGAYVRRSRNGISQFNQDLLKFISDTFRQAEAQFSFSPRVFANLMYTYISKAGSIDDLYLVINDDETMEVDARLLATHFRCRFFPVEVSALENPSPTTKQTIRTARGCITTKYHLERVASLFRRTSKRIIEIKRDPRFVTDVLNSAASQNVLVVMSRSATTSHYRDLVFKKLYPEIVDSISFASLSVGGEKKLQEKMTGTNLIYASPLCYEAVKKLAPPQANVVQIQGWISSESLENIRALLLYQAES